MRRGRSGGSGGTPQKLEASTPRALAPGRAHSRPRGTRHSVSARPIIYSIENSACKHGRRSPCAFIPISATYACRRADSSQGLKLIAESRGTPAPETRGGILGVRRGREAPPKPQSPRGAWCARASCAQHSPGGRRRDWARGGCRRVVGSPAPASVLASAILSGRG